MPTNVHNSEKMSENPECTSSRTSISSSNSERSTQDCYGKSGKIDIISGIPRFSEVQPLLKPKTQASCQCCGRRREPRTQWQRLKERVLFLFSKVTVEPVMFLNVLAWTLQTTLVTNMVLEKVCENSFNLTTSCANLTLVPADASADIQRRATMIMMVQEVVANIPAVLYVLILGTWSDQYGRKLPMLLPFVGSFVASLMYMANAYLWWLPPELVIMAGIPRGMSGGLITLLMATYAYISDVSDHKTRTLRMAFLDLVMFIGTPLGLYLSSVIFNRYHYTGIFTVSCTAFLLGILYILIRIEDTRGPSVDPKAFECPSLRKRMFSDLLDLSKIKSSLAIATRRRENYGRAKIFSLMVALCLLLFILGGLQLKYLYTKVKFNWTYEQFINLSIYDIVLGSLGTSLILPILSYKFKVEDTTLGLVGCISKIIGLVLLAISPVPSFLYLAATLSFLAGLPLIVTRAVISKLVPPEEVGAIFSLLASWEALVPLVSTPVYTFIYAATVDYFPGTIYYVSSFATAVSAFIYLFNSLAGQRGQNYSLI